MIESTSKSSSSTFNQEETFEIDLKSILSLIKNSYKLIVIITTLFFIIGIYYAETRPPSYQSEAMIQVGNNDLGSSLGGSGSAMATLSGLAGKSSSGAVETVLMKSPYIWGKVVRQMDLAISVSPHYSGFFAKKWAALRHIKSGNVSVSTLEVPDNLLSKPLILTVHNTNQYSLSTSNGKKILDGTVGEIKTVLYFSQPLKINVTTLNAKPGAQFDLVKQQIADVANDIAGALSIREEGMGTGIMKLRYVSGDREQTQALLNGILTVAIQENIKEKSQEAAKTMQFISDQLPISRNRLENAEDTFNQYSVKKGIFNPMAESETLEENIDALNDTLDQSKFNKFLLLQKFTHLYPLVIAETQKEDQIKSRIKKIRKKLMQLPPIEEKEINLQRDAKIKSEFYTALVISAQRMEMMKASMISSVRILSPATYPVSRIPVNKRAIIFGSVIFGIMTSLMIIFIRHMLSPVIEDPDAVERKLGKSVIAIIPYSEKQANYNRKIKKDKLYENNHPFLLVRENPNDTSIEGVRSLRTAVQTAFLETSNNVLSITGCSPGVGKSFVSSNLAVLLSDLSKKVLIIDSDMRLGKLSQCFGKAKAPGLSTYLQNEETLEAIIQNVVPGKLDFISTGLYPENPSELLFQKKFEELVKIAQDRYDFVIIDTPPILAVTDAALILKYSSVNLMVLGIGKDQMKEVLYAKSILEKNGINLSGVIFNTLKQPKSGFGKSYGYGNYSYEYGTRTK